MQTFDRAALRDRALEEIDRVLANSKPRLTLGEMSQALRNNSQFLSSFKAYPEKYTLTLKDLFQLNALYNIDDVYIMKGIRFQKLQCQLEQLRTLLNTI